MGSHSGLGFKLKDAIVDTFRALKQDNINQQLNEIEIGGLHQLLSGAREELKVYKGVLANAPNPDDSNTLMVNMYLNQSFERVGKLTE